MDGAYGQAFIWRLRVMGIRDRPISPQSPWQNPYAERLIGSLRRDCLDHVLIFGERHLRGISRYMLIITTRRAHIWGWARMRRYDEPSNDLGPSSPHPSCPDCIIATRGYDSREEQVLIPLVHARAVRLTTRRLEVVLPESMAEVQAEKDLLRAEFAMSTRRLEMTVEQLVNRPPARLSNSARKTTSLNRLKVERDAQEAEIITLKTEVDALK